MHDPMAVAFDVKRPWPKRRLRGELRRYYPAIITVWHVEPGGQDSGTVCKGRWQWHVHHWRLQFPPLQALRRRMLTKCEWCKGPSVKGDPVNVSMGWDGRDRGPWWKGERHLYHSDCLSIESAHKACICGPDVGAKWKHGDYGTCSICGGFRVWSRRDDPAAEVRLVTTALLRSIPVGGRDPGIMAVVEGRWRAYRHQLDRHTANGGRS